jgi:hypothetical protein
MSKTLTENDILELAKKFSIDQAAIKAVKEIESRGSGFLPSGKPIILFEGHVFWKQLTLKGKNPKDYIMNNYDIIYPTWDKSQYKGGEKEYDRLNKAIAIDKEAALKSASWGLFQIMGFNHKLAGYDTVQHFVEAQYENEKNQLEAFANFIKSSNLIDELQNKQWAAFAKAYNGAQYAQNQYDIKLQKAFEKYYIAPKVEAPKVEAPKVEVHKTETPKVEAPKASTAKADTTKVSQPTKKA